MSKYYFIQSVSALKKSQQLECFENFIEKHLDDDEERYYNLKQK